jgi:hypothetical protein
MPGGEVRLLDVDTGRAEVVSDECRVPLHRVDCTAAQLRIAAGFDDGIMRVWGI